MDPCLQVANIFSQKVGLFTMPFIPCSEINLSVNIYGLKYVVNWSVPSFANGRIPLSWHDLLPFGTGFYGPAFRHSEFERLLIRLE